MMEIHTMTPDTHIHILPAGEKGSRKKNRETCLINRQTDSSYLC